MWQALLFWVWPAAVIGLRFSILDYLVVCVCVIPLFSGRFCLSRRYCTCLRATCSWPSFKPALPSLGGRAEGVLYLLFLRMPTDNTCIALVLSICHLLLHHLLHLFTPSSLLHELIRTLHQFSVLVHVCSI